MQTTFRISLLGAFICLTLIEVKGQNKYNSQKATLYAILVADVTDQQIGTGMQRTLDNIQPRLKTIAQVNKLNLKTFVLTKNRFNKKSVDATLKRGFYCRPLQDYIFFVYLGHGHQTNNQNDKVDLLPTLYLGGANLQTPQKGSLKLSVVRQRLKAKKPRFLFIINESCNAPTQITKAAPNRVDTLTTAPPKNYIKKGNLTKMFRGIGRGSEIVLVSASRGQPSYIAKEGGFFAMSFFSALEQVLSESTQSTVKMWETFLAEVQKKTIQKAHEYGIHDQEPFYYGLIKQGSSNKLIKSKKVSVGIGVPQKKAIRLWKKAETLGNREATRRIAKPPTTNELFRNKKQQNDE